MLEHRVATLQSLRPKDIWFDYGAKIKDDVDSYIVAIVDSKTRRVFENTKEM